MTVNVENVTKLINHYKVLPGLLSWSYDDCAAGVLAKLGIITIATRDYEVADALNVTMDQVFDIVSGPRSATWGPLDPVQKRDTVVAMLEGLLENGDVDWGVPN